MVRFVVAFPAKLVAASSLMRFWVPEDHVHPAVWISVYAVLSITFNLFNVRRYGEIEFWLTTLKCITLAGLIILGLLLAMGASNESWLSGTNSNNVLIPCNDLSTDNCVSLPGFKCIILSFISNVRLERRWVERLSSWSCVGSVSRFLVVLLPGMFGISGGGNHWHYSG
jgi:amino acid permease